MAVERERDKKILDPHGTRAPDKRDQFQQLFLGQQKLWHKKVDIVLHNGFDIHVALRRVKDVGQSKMRRGEAFKHLPRIWISRMRRLPFLWNDMRTRTGKAFFRQAFP